ncbi:uncharacterized protein LOC121371825 isoform X1 [Gigantopelta aegis]|uniref:uncharacterized protein LOC121371825 isoform X1 n=1 Tax=Gigantopelta aegis TaxID=1735272 RepID=UPI001B88A7FA|nr:uncharacterized protein LOC121371825 isoform X1 [Gigantopelta aegis]XP_041353946.1 uncharacterized protein LOC121371825 isoform X1 [Gigantopelta aegis]
MFGVQHPEITFTKHVNTTDNFAANIGTTNVTDKQKDLSLGAESRDEQTVPKDLSLGPKSKDEQTVPKVVGTNPISDKLKLVKVINTKGVTSPDLSSIDVLNIQDSVKIVVADNANSCIKCYNYDDGTLHCVCKTSGKPRCLTKLGNGNHVAVTIPTHRQIIFVEVDSIITTTKSIHTGKSYSWITQLLDSSLAVSVWASDPGYVDILDLNGHVIRSISDLPPEPRYLTSLGESLLVMSYKYTCKAFTRVTLSPSSRHIDWVKSRDSMMLKDARGITCDGHGFIYVTDFDRHSVVQISADGDVIRDIMTQQDGLVNPRAVCFVRDCLYLTQENGEIKIFTWT